MWFWGLWRVLLFLNNGSQYLSKAAPRLMRGVRFRALRKTIYVSRWSHPAQQDNCFTSLLNVWVANFSPSTMVR